MSPRLLLLPTLLLHHTFTRERDRTDARRRRSGAKSQPRVVDPSTAFGRPLVALSADRSRVPLASAWSSRR